MVLPPWQVFMLKWNLDYLNIHIDIHTCSLILYVTDKEGYGVFGLEGHREEREKNSKRFFMSRKHRKENVSKNNLWLE